MCGLGPASSARVGVVLLLRELGVLVGAGGRGASRGRVYVLVVAGLGSCSRGSMGRWWSCCWCGCGCELMGCLGRGHCGVGGEWPVDGRHIGEFLGLLGKDSQLLLPSLLLLFWFRGGGENSRRGCCEGLVALGVTGIGAREPDCRFMVTERSCCSDLGKFDYMPFWCPLSRTEA